MSRCLRRIELRRVDLEKYNVLVCRRSSEHREKISVFASPAPVGRAQSYQAQTRPAKSLFLGPCWCWRPPVGIRNEHESDTEAKLTEILSYNPHGCVRSFALETTPFRRGKSRVAFVFSDSDFFSLVMVPLQSRRRALLLGVQFEYLRVRYPRIATSSCLLLFIRSKLDFLI